MSQQHPLKILPCDSPSPRSQWGDKHGEGCGYYWRAANSDVSKIAARGPQVIAFPPTRGAIRTPVFSLGWRGPVCGFGSFRTVPLPWEPSPCGGTTAATPGQGTVHHLHRRARRGRPGAGGRLRRGQRRARADCEPAADRWALGRARTGGSKWRCSGGRDFSTIFGICQGGEDMDCPFKHVAGGGWTSTTAK